jgi:hypothetical protein
MNKLFFTWQQNVFVGERLNWRERNLNLEEFKIILFLDQIWMEEMHVSFDERIYSD